MKTLLFAAAAFALSAAPKTVLKVEVKPATAEVYVDGKKRGTGAEAVEVSVKPGTHMVKVVNGLDAHEEPVTLKKGETKTWRWAFEDDRMDKKTKASDGDETPIELPVETEEPAP